MRFQSLFWAAFAGIATAKELTRCGTVEPDDSLKADLNAAYFSKTANITTSKARSVDTYVHVVTTQAKRSKYTKAMVTEQVRLTL